MKLVKTEEAVGCTLCHDLTRIIPGVEKGAAFRKGHIVTEADVPALLSMGKENLYVWEDDPDKLHENDAAYILRDICKGANIIATEPKEGKIDLIAECDGLFLLDRSRLNAVNGIGEIIIAARHGGFAVKAGDKLAGTRVIPLMIDKTKMERARAVAGDTPLMYVSPFNPKRVGVVTTGNEVYHKRIEDGFTPVIGRKLAEYGGEVAFHTVLPDDHERITAAINEQLTGGADMVLCTGGMSVDPDDRTPLAIKNAAARVVSYGAPVLPGSMFMLAYSEDGRPICGLPGCVMYNGRTIFDLALPYLMADAPITAERLTAYGEGGLCLGCEPCVFPNCGFGK